MLILSRKKDESIIIGNDIEITVIEVQGDQVKLGIFAPKNVSIHRKEIYIEIKEENLKASKVADIPIEALNLNLKKKD